MPVNPTRVSRLTLEASVILAMVLMLTPSLSQPAVSRSSNLVIEKRHVFRHFDELVDNVQRAQKNCVETVKLAPALGPAVTLISRSRIEELLAQRRITEYFAGDRYARIETVPLVTTGTFMMPNPVQGKLDCRIREEVLTEVEVRTSTHQFLTASHSPHARSEAKVEWLDITPEHAAAGRARVKRPRAVSAELSTVPGLNVQCQWDTATVTLCLLGGMNVHTGTGREVVLIKKNPLTMDRDKAFSGPIIYAALPQAEQRHSMRGGFSDIETVKIAFGGDVPADVFEIPAFARGYPVHRK